MIAMAGQKDGFKGERSIVMPPMITEVERRDPLASSLYVTDLGYYPRAYNHFCERKKPITENVLIYCVEGMQTPHRIAPHIMIAEILPADMPWADKATGWGGYVMPWEFYNTFNYADKRLACIHTDYVSTTGEYTDKTNSAQLKYGALPLKYGIDPNMTGAQAGNDLIIYRYPIPQAFIDESNGPVLQIRDVNVIPQYKLNITF